MKHPKILPVSTSRQLDTEHRRTIYGFDVIFSTLLRHLRYLRYIHLIAAPALIQAETLELSPRNLKAMFPLNWRVLSHDLNTIAFIISSSDVERRRPM